VVDLETHIQDVVNVLHYEDLTDVVLVGWSYGGMIVAGAADWMPERIGHLVYLDSDVPRDGDTSAPASAHSRLIELAEAHGEGWFVPPEVTRAHAYLLTGLPEEQADWIAARFAPHPVVTWLQPIRLTGAAAHVPTTYIRCTVGYDPDDEDTRRQDDRIRSEPTWQVRELAETHAAPFTAPRAVAQILLDIASYDSVLASRDRRPSAGH
jgi:pimeloyl-ACP methyl ester carboxylesterase